MAQQETYKFPDEIEGDKDKQMRLDFGDGDMEIEVVDDAPPEDQNRKPLPAKQVEEVEKDDLEEYSEKAKYRLSQLKKVWHDERRAKEAATREREEAMNYAAMKEKEIRELRTKLNRGEQIFVTEVSKAAQNEVGTAKEKLKQAYEAGDADLIADAQEALTDAKLKLREMQSIKNSLQPEEKDIQSGQREERGPYEQQVQQAQRPVKDPKAEAWRAENKWFGTDPAMTSLALGVHEKLVRNNYDPTSDEYYDEVNKEMRKRFPEHFEDAEETKPRDDEQPAARTRPNTVVASVSRSTAPKRIRLKASEMTLIKKLGITPEQYVRETMKLGNANG
jgi:hypothetical protein